LWCFAFRSLHTFTTWLLNRAATVIGTSSLVCLNILFGTFS
jgi:hypothetical protein